MTALNRAPGRSPNPSGWRKEDEARARFIQMSKMAPIGRHSRKEIWNVAQRAMRALKLNATRQKLLETLIFRTFEHDWDAGSRPIVWLKNAELAEAAGLAISANTVRICLAHLAELGLITYQDSGNCRRFGRRDEEDRIIFAYGIDLGVLEARYDELAAIAERHEAETSAVKETRPIVQRLRRSIPAHLQSAELQQLDGRWGTFRRRYDRVVRHLGRSSTADLTLLSRVERILGRLLDQVQKAMVRCASAENNDATASQKGCLLEITSPTHHFVRSIDERNCATAQSIQFTSDAGSAGDRALDNCVGGSGDVESKSPTSSSYEIHLTSVLAACPEVLNWTDGEVNDWRDLIAAAGQLRGACGVSPSAWQEARAVMGAVGAAVAMAIILQKHAVGLVKQPGGYLRGMTDRYRAGALRLDRTIRGLLSEQRRNSEVASKLPIPGSRRSAMPYIRSADQTPRLI